MFNKKCPRCGRKIAKEYDFCPYCGNDFRWEKRIEKERDYGFLGKDDELFQAQDFNIRMPFGFNSLFNSLLKEVDKQFRELDKEMAREKQEKAKKVPEIRKSGISISISMSGKNKPDIKISGYGPEFSEFEREIKEVKIPKNKITDEEARKLAKLPRKEAKTEVRRFSNKIVYEIDLPGIKNLKDVIINKLENSVEIKAFAKDTAYFKLLPINLPILNYKLEDSKLILEFQP